jgi:hypothetical protein
MPRKRTVAVATSVSAALIASTTAFAVANGIFGAPPTDRVGRYHIVEQQLAPANEVAPTTVLAPPTSASTTTVRGATTGAADDARRVRVPNTAAAPAVTPGNDTQLAPAPAEQAQQAPSIAPPASTTPTTQSTASTVPTGEHETDGHDSEPDDNGRASDD